MIETPYFHHGYTWVGGGACGKGFNTYIRLLQRQVHVSFYKWRQFPFFEAAPVKDIHDLANAPEIFKVGHFSTFAVIC